jgi:hypothetical protein
MEQILETPSLTTVKTNSAEISSLEKAKKEIKNN